MAKITKIKPQKTRSRVNIYLDGKFAFALPLEALAKRGLKVGQELTERQIENLIFKSEFQKLLGKALRFISLRPRSEKEIKDYLGKKLPNQHAAASLVGRILTQLKKLGLLDDSAFVAWWLEQRSIFLPRGKIALKMELRQKGINREIIDKALGQIDEIPLAQKATAKKMKTYGKLKPLEFRQKMGAFLSRRGFSWETIKSVVDRQEKKR